MQTVDELLEKEETLIGTYNMEVARWSNKHWSPTMPALYVILTEHRLILQAQARKRYEPAIIPANAISKVTALSDNYHREIVIIHLKTGHILSLYTGRQGDQFIKCLRHAAFPQSPIKFKNDLDLDRLQKIISYMERL